MIIYITKFDNKEQAKEYIISEYSKLRKKHFELRKLPSGQPLLMHNGKKYGFMSITHTEDIMAIAFSRCKIGIDIEHKDREISSKVAKSIEEWTRKEAYGKMLGVGINKAILTLELDDKQIKSYRLGEYILSVSSKDMYMSQIALTTI